MISRLFTRIAARRLGRRSHRNTLTTHDRIIATTLRIREELEMGEDPRLAL